MNAAAVTLDPLSSPPRVEARGLRSRLLSREAVPVVALTVLAAALRFWRISHQGFWFDEGNTALLVHFSPGAMLGLIPQSESTPPLYYCVAWVWARVFGYSEAPLRALSATFGVAVVPLIHLAGAKLVSRRAGLIAAALTACNPLLIWYSQEARAYEMLLFLTAASLVAFVYARTTPTRRWLAAWVIASGLALATHYYALLAVVPQAIWLLAEHRRRHGVQIAVAFAGLCGLGLIPLAVAQKSNGLSGWISTVALSRRLGAVVPQSLMGFGSPAYGVLEPLAVALVLLALLLLVTRSDPDERRGALVAAGLLLGGLVLKLLLIAGGHDDLITRNLLALWVPAALLVAGGLAARRARLAGVTGVIATVALCGVGVTAALGVSLNRDLQRPDWRVVAAALGPRMAGQAPRAIFIQHYRDLLPLSLYLRGLTRVGGHGATVSELYIVSFTSPPSTGFCWWGSACNLWPSRMQASYPIAGFHEISRRRVHQFTVLRLVSDTPVLITRRQVGRALRTTRLRSDELLLLR